MILRICHPKSTAQSLWNASGPGSICRMLRSVPASSGHRGVMQEPNGYGAWLLPAEHGDDDDEDDDDDNGDVG